MALNRWRFRFDLPRDLCVLSFSNELTRVVTVQCTVFYLLPFRHKTQFFIICCNVLGSCYGSTGPSSINPATKKHYATDFPILAVKDMVDSQFLLLVRGSQVRFVVYMYFELSLPAFSHFGNLKDTDEHVCSQCLNYCSLLGSAGSPRD